MKISRAEVEKVATLARLELSEEEVEHLTEDLSSILSYIAKLEELDTSDVEPTSHVVAMKTPYREDIVTNEPSTDDALANAPQHDNNYFVVPSIIE
jgi:aspartyl-tRNA(Asn)/glutamyl-tRNA(Gln) amidotransferase subunit C